MKIINSGGTLTGYETTEDFLYELKKNINITNICSDSKITNCFPKKVIWTEGEDAVEITSSAVTYSDSDEQDWAETLRVQFVNGVETLIAYNKNCTDDPYNNQFSPISECIGIVYDVSGGKKPNTNGKDLTSVNVTSISGDSGCVYELSDGTCFTKIIFSGTCYSPLTYDEYTSRKSELGLDISLEYNVKTYATLNTEKAAVFLSTTLFSDSSDVQFMICANQEWSDYSSYIANFPAAIRVGTPTATTTAMDVELWRSAWLINHINFACRLFLQV